MQATRSQTGTARAPVHLWVIGAVSLLWNAFGCLDYVLTNVRDPGYVAQFPPDMIDYIDAFPGWMLVVWAMGVGFALVGSVLLLARSRWAVAAFALSLLGLAGSQAYQLVAELPPGMNTAANWGMTAVIWIIEIALLIYAVRMRRQGVLR